MPDNAVEALKATIAESKIPRVAISAEHERLCILLSRFSTAIEAVDEEMVFTVVDIITWAKKYAEAEEMQTTDLPQALQRTHTLGKLLAKDPEGYGFTSAGSYGNRQVYMLKGLENG